MRKDITVTAEVRTSRGKNEAHRTRREGKIPAVVYGAYQDPISVAVNPREILKIVRSTTGYNTIFNLSVGENGATPVMVVDHQVDPIKGTLLHADFKRIDLTKRIRVSVPVHTSGEPQGVKVQGGLLEVVTRSVEIECLPEDIPESFSVEGAMLQNSPMSRFLSCRRRTTCTQRNSSIWSMRGISPPSSAASRKSAGCRMVPSSWRSRVKAS